MKRTVGLIFLLSLISFFVSCETTEEVIVKPVYKEKKLIISPFDKKTVLGGKFTLIPRFVVMEENREKLVQVKLKSIRYSFDGKQFFTSVQTPFYVENDFSFVSNGQHLLEVEAIDVDGFTNSFAANFYISNIQVLMRVRTKDSVPDGYKLYFSGSPSRYIKNGKKDEWEARGAIFTQISNGIYETKISVGIGELLQYEMNLGSWALKARDPKGTIIHKSVKITGPDQIIEDEIDNFGLYKNKIMNTGYAFGFTGDAKDLTVAYIQKKAEVAKLSYSYDNKKYLTLESTATQFCQYTIEPQFGKKLYFAFSTMKGTNAIDLPKRGLPFDFGIISDVGVRANTKMPTILSAESNLAFILDLGDLVLNGHDLNEWNTYLNLARPMTTKFLYQPTLGNHDEETSIYNAVTGKPFWYSFVWENCYFISLDVLNNYDPDSKQYAWLEQELQKAQSYRFRIVYFHIPPYSTRRHGEDPAIQSYIVPLLEKYKVNIVFSGHNHGYEVSYPLIGGKPAEGGVVYCVFSGGGSELYPSESKPEWLKFEKQSFHYVKVRVYEDRMEFTAIDDQKKIFDTFTIQ